MRGDLSELSDEELMKKYQLGNEIAFVTLYHRHSAKVYGFLTTKLREKPLVDDVFQATFLKLHQARLKYDATYPFLPWLFAVCKSSMIDCIRKKRKILEKYDSERVEAAIAPEIVETVLPNLNDLSVVQRQVLQLRYHHDFSFEEIAKQMDTTPSNARQLVSRAVRKLKALLKSGKENL